MHMYPLSKVSFQLKLPFRSYVGGGFTQPPPLLGQGVGQKHLGRARVKSQFFKLKMFLNMHIFVYFG